MQWEGEGREGGRTSGESWPHNKGQPQGKKVRVLPVVPYEDKGSERRPSIFGASIMSWCVHPGWTVAS